jgi:hypothetical protein
MQSSTYDSVTDPELNWKNPGPEQFSGSETGSDLFDIKYAQNAILHLEIVKVVIDYIRISLEKLSKTVNFC